MPEKTNSQQIADLRSLSQACSHIYQYFNSDRAQEKTLALFKSITSPDENSSPKLIVQNILKAAREIRQFIIENNDGELLISRDESIDLTGKLYELAINQIQAENPLNLIQEVTFFYLIVGNAEQFLRWSRVLLDHIEGNDPEQRATLFAIGLAQIFIDEPAQAEMTFHRLLHIYPESSESYLGLCLAYVKLQEKSKSDDYYKRLLLSVYKQLKQSAPELAMLVDRLAMKPNFTAEDYAAELENLDLSE